MSTSAGLDRVLRAGARSITVPASAGEPISPRGRNVPIAKTPSQLSSVVTSALGEGLAVTAQIAMCFGDPCAGDVVYDRVGDVATALHGMGCREVSLTDATGAGAPGDVSELLGVLRGRSLPSESLAVCFHDTHGHALANTMVALMEGVRVLGSTAGLADSRFPRRAARPLSTETLVRELHRLGVGTGVDLEMLQRVGGWTAQQVERHTRSRAAFPLAPRPARATA